MKMKRNQIEASELAKQINELSEKLSALIQSDLENLSGYALTVVTSALDEKGKLSVKSFSGGKRTEILNAQKDLMMKSRTFCMAIYYALIEAYTRKRNSIWRVVPL